MKRNENYVTVNVLSNSSTEVKMLCRNLQENSKSNLKANNKQETYF